MSFGRWCLSVARVAFLWLSFTVSAHAQVQFVDVTTGSGVEYTGESYGASWGDANGDGLPDLFVSHHRYAPGLYINQGDGTFEDRNFEIDVWQSVPRSDLHGGTFADYNNDGFLDLVITAGSKNFTQFLKNNGSFLTDRITDFTFDRQSWGARLPLWFDFSNDGLLDLGIVVQGAKVQLHEQVGGDFERRNAASGHECFNGDYSHLSDLTMDGQLDWVCISHDSGSPERIYDYTVGVPFLDQTALAVPVANVIDSAIADFDGDQIMDLFLLRGKVRINGAEIVAPNSIEAHLANSNGQDAGITFESAGDLTIELHWSARNVGQIFIGAGGLNPDPVEPDVPISFTLSASDPDVVGTVPYDPMVDRGIYIGYDPATQTWTYFNSPGTGSFSYTYSYIDSTAPMSNLNVFGIRAQETPRTPSMLKFDGAQYTDQIAFTGLNETVLCNSVAAADYDNDGDVDLYYVCRDAVSNLANRLYLNDGTGVFSAAALPFGAEGPVGPGVGLGENVVASDYDVDGFVDLFVTNGLKLYPMLIGYTAGGPDKLFRNLGNSNNWIQLDLTGTTSNRDGLGAIVTATSGGKTQRREQNGGYHRWAQHDTRIHFGLGVNLTVDLSVQWPSGIVDNYLEVPVNAVYEIVEGSATITPVAIPTSTPPSVCAETAGPPDYDPNVDRELFIWKDDCGSNNWKVRVTGGAGPDFTYTGDVQSGSPFLAVTGVNLETGDVLDFTTNPTRIEFGLDVGEGREDGFDFTVDPGASTCFGTTANFATAIGGQMRTPLPLPFDLETLGPCSGAEPSVSVDDVMIAENDPAGVATFTVSLSSTSTDVVTVEYATVDNSAASPTDYTADADVLTFLAGEDTKTVDIAIVDDSDPELLETFSLVLSNPTNAQLGVSTGTATIIDDEPSACGVPIYDRASEHALFIWQDCETGEWSARVTAGGQSATFAGNAVSTMNFTDVTPFSVESADVLDFVTDPAEIAFQLKVGNAGQDGFDFQFPVSASVCFDLAAPSVPVYFGENRSEVTLPVDLDTLGPCIVPPTSDLLTVKTLSSGDPLPAENDTVEFSITITNNGPDEATNVSLIDNLPSGLTATVNNGTVTDGVYLAGTGTWSIATLAVSQSATLTLEGTVDAGQSGVSITNTTTAATADQVDPSNAGDQLSAGVVVDPGLSGADLVTVKTLASGDSMPAESDIVTYLLTVTNNGPAEATNVSLTDSLPVGLTPTINNGLASQGVYGSDVWDIGTLTSGASATLTLEGTIDSGQAGNTITNITTAAAGDQPDVTSAGDDLSETVVVDGPAETPLTAWALATGGVTTIDDQIFYSGSPTGWNNNSVISLPLSSLGYSDNFEVQFTIDSDPLATTWVVGLGETETNSNWRDVDYALRSTSGVFQVYESGAWRTTGPALAQGDVVTIAVMSGLIEYRLNGVVMINSSYSGQPEFYVDTSFNTGAIALSVLVVGNPDAVTPPQETPIDVWSATTGGVSVVADSLSYSGSPTGWVNNTATSVPLSSLGATDNYSVRWEITSDPASTTWVFGLGVVESSPDWRDVDYGLRSSAGGLRVYESGAWAATGPALALGDVLSIYVDGTVLEYRLNGALIHSTTILGTEDFYIDSSFKEGAVNFGSITLVEF